MKRIIGRTIVIGVLVCFPAVVVAHPLVDASPLDDKKDDKAKAKSKDKGKKKSPTPAPSSSH